MSTSGPASTKATAMAVDETTSTTTTAAAAAAVTSSSSPPAVAPDSAPPAATTSASGATAQSHPATTRQDEGLNEESTAAQAADAAAAASSNAAASLPSMSLTSDEVNYLIFRYLQECGYVHSAFTFVYESMLGRSNIRNAEKSIPPGALVNFLQKGLQYVGIEESLQQEAGEAKTSKKEPAGLSLLSSQTVAALNREAPKIHLNVPPASAAAAVRARLEVEAKVEAERKAAAVKAAKDSHSSANNGRKKQAAAPGPMSIPAQPIVDDPATVMSSVNHNHEQSVLAVQEAAAAAAVSGLGIHPLHSGNGAVMQQSPVDSAGTAALMAQQRRALEAEIAAIEDQQQQLQLHQQLQQQQHQQIAHSSQLQHQQQHLHDEQQKLLLEHERLRQLELQQQQNQQQLDAAAAALAKTQAQQQQQQHSGSKRSPSSSKKGHKSKGKSSKQRTTSPKSDSQQQQQENKSSTSKSKSSSAFASLAEAAAQSSTKNHDKSTRNSNPAASPATPSSKGGSSGPVAMDTDESGKNHSNSATGTPSQTPKDATHDGKNGVIPDANGKYGHKKAQKHGKLGQNGGKHGVHVVDASGNSVSSSNNNINRNAATSNGNGHADGGIVSSSNAGASNPQAAVNDDDDGTMQPRSEVLDLKMHSSEVFMCAWNPIFTDIIATGSGDASARIWKMGGPKASDGLGPVKLLPHGIGPKDKKNKDVTTLEWSSDGKLLATGSYDGVARVWSQNGSLVHTLRGHKGPIFSLKWNKRGNFLLSGSYDKSTIVWDVSGSTGSIQQQFNEHEEPALDVDWMDDTTFASCSTDKTVHICRVGVPRPLKIYTGHTDEVNAVKWDPSGTLLASCSDDCTAKVWEFKSDRLEPLHDFKSHQQEIYTVKWSPTGPGSSNPDKQPMLATASFDGSVRLWNVRDGSCYRIFSRHSDSVYSVAFSPSGDFLASGSLAGQLYIWNVKLGVHIKSFKGEGDIFEVAWNKEETRVAACFSSNVVSVIDFRR